MDRHAPRFQIRTRYETVPEVVGPAAEHPRHPRPDLAPFLEDGRYIAAATLDFHPLLGRNPEAVAAVRARLEPVEYRAGEIIAGLPEPNRGISYMRHGRANLVIRDHWGRERVFTQYRYGVWAGVPGLLYAWRQRTGRLGADEQWPEHRLVALPRQHDPEAPITVDQLPLEDALELMDRYPEFLAWVEHNVALRFDRGAEVQALLRANPLLRSLVSEDRHYLLQLGALRRFQGPGTYLRQGEPAGRVALMLSGEGQCFLRDADGGQHLVSRLVNGGLVGHERLATDAEIAGLADGKTSFDVAAEESRRATSAYLANDSELLEFDWQAFRWTLGDRPDTWVPTLEYLKPGTDQSVGQAGQLVFFSGARRGLGTSTLALGCAMALAETVNETIDPTGASIVWLVDAQAEPGQRIRTRFGLDFKPSHPPPLDQRLLSSIPSRDFKFEDFEVHFEVLKAPEGEDRSHVVLVWGRSREFDGRGEAVGQGMVAALEVLINALRAHPLSRYVVVDLPAHGEFAGDAIRERLNTEDALFVWVQDGAGNPVARGETAGLPDQVPTDLIMVDRLTPALRRDAAHMPETVSLISPIGLQMEPPPWRHRARVPDDPQTASRLTLDNAWELLLGEGSAERVLGRASRRLARMVRGRTVGLALGGGGVWGFAHIPLFQLLKDHHVPIDYIAGTSAGATMGGLYAGGGHKALFQLLEENPSPPESLKDTPLGPLIGMRTSRLFHASVLKVLRDSTSVQEMVDRILSQTTGQRIDLQVTELPFFGCGTDMEHRQVGVPHTGSVGWGVRVASGLPPVLPSVSSAGSRFTDGAFLANVPAPVVRAHGADFVIAVNVVSPANAENIEEDSGSAVKRLAAGLLPRRITDIFQGIWMTLWKAGVDQAGDAADVTLDLWTLDVAVLATWRGGEIAARCREGLEEQQVGEQLYSLWRDPRRWREPPYLRITNVTEDP
jgi:predicted acylesterase/phospholipase RssA/CRP-like cAMP-binding protein